MSIYSICFIFLFLLYFIYLFKFTVVYAADEPIDTLLPAELIDNTYETFQNTSLEGWADLQAIEAFLPNATTVEPVYAIVEPILQKGS
jgi:Fe2+ transport system protein B